MPDTTPIDPVALTQALIRCESVTPEEGGALDLLQRIFEGLGFRVWRQVFTEEGTPPVDNLYARYGDAAPNLCFAGHTDVVPVGDAAGWTYPPFAAEIHDGVLYGRGAEDMKAAIAAFVAAASRIIASGSVSGSVSLLITGDEEGPAINGTRKMLTWIAQRGETLDACIVGEPTNPTELGQMVKIGRRGSVTAYITIRGTQGHVAYPHLAENPATALVEILHRLQSHRLDDGTAHFQPSNLEITTIDIGNPADNVIPAEARAAVNIRFNDRHSSDSLKEWIRSVCESVCASQQAGMEAKNKGQQADTALSSASYASQQASMEAKKAPSLTLSFRVTGESFLTEPGEWSARVAEAVETVTGIKPELSTSGGTSDARFIKDYCPVVEFGTTGKTPHKVNECVRVADIVLLSQVYERVLAGVDL